MIKRCVVCGEEFETSDGRVKYCSAECRRVGLRRYNTQYIKNRKERDPVYLAKYNEWNRRASRKWQDRNRREKYIEHAKQIKRLDDIEDICDYIMNNFKTRKDK